MRILAEGPPATIRDVRALEKQLGIKLPASYVNVMLRHNGGMPDPGIYTSADGSMEVEVGVLFKITNDSIRETTGTFPYSIGNGLLPIGIAGGGDYLFLSLQTGAIYLWDHEEVFSLDFGPADLVYLEKSLDDVLARLGGEEWPEDSEMLLIGESGDMKRLEEFVRENDIDAIGDDGWTVAQSAAKHGKLDLLKRCLELGASTSELMFCAVAGMNRGIVEYLLSIGVDINQKSLHGKVPLSHILLTDEFRAYLISKGAVE
jgi:hypothetical protein